MIKPSNRPYFIASAIFHVGVLAALVMSFDFSAPLPVIENTNKNDVISAVVLGDTEKSKILPQKPLAQPVIQPPPPKAEEKPQKEERIQQVIKKDVIAIKMAEKKKLAEKQAKEAKKQQALFEKELLADIKKQAEKKKTKPKPLKPQFDKMLKEQAEKSLRQQLLNEEIKLKGSESREAQGEVNKYKALIIQAISEHWLVPTQANKKLYCELMIRVAPGGMVLDVQVIKTSGDPSLDSSARAAVLKASPLPVPSDSSAFESFRQFVLKVKPENILNDM